MTETISPDQASIDHLENEGGPVEPDTELLNDQKQFQEDAQNFAKEFGDVLQKYIDKLPYAHIAKILQGTSVDLLVALSAIQAQYAIQQVLANHAATEEDKATRKIITL